MSHKAQEVLISVDSPVPENRPYRAFERLIDFDLLALSIIKFDILKIIFKKLLRPDDLRNLHVFCCI
ncbi:MAG: hypothetical protein HRT36_02595 [Alphaproteobacteria bacterium]|nr:hypothetical protein [Alphaproteobacteria bacterium]